MTYALWFKGIYRLDPAAVSALGFLSPLSAVVIGWMALGQALTIWQMTGAAIVLTAVALAQHGGRAPSFKSSVLTSNERINA